MVRRCNRIGQSYPLITILDEVIIEEKLSLNPERVLFNLFLATKTHDLDVKLLKQAVNCVIYFMKE